MTLSTNFSHINVTNNSIGMGNYASSYKYDGDGYMNGADAHITNNYFTSYTNGTTADKLFLNDCSCVIVGNSFVRNIGSAVNSYIKSLGTKNHVITNNTFNDSTVDGSDEFIVKGLTSGSVYNSNKNQIDYKVLSPIDFTNASGDTKTSIESETNSYIHVDVNPDDFSPAYYSPNLLIHAGNSASFGLFMNVGNVLSSGVKILGFKMAYKVQDGYNAASGTNVIQLSAGSFTALNTYAGGTSAMPNSIIDIDNNNLNSATAVSDFSSGIPVGVQYLELNVSFNNNFETYNKTIHLALQGQISFLGPNGILLSPILVRYKW